MREKGNKIPISQKKCSKEQITENRLTYGFIVNHLYNLNELA